MEVVSIQVYLILHASYPKLPAGFGENMLVRIFKFQYHFAITNHDGKSKLNLSKGSLQSVVCSLQSVVCSLQCVVCSLQCVVCSLQSVVCSLQSVVCSLQSVVCSLKLFSDQFTGWKNGGSRFGVCCGGEYFSLRQSVQIDSLAHPASSLRCDRYRG